MALSYTGRAEARREVQGARLQEVDKLGWREERKKESTSDSPFLPSSRHHRNSRYVKRINSNETASSFHFTSLEQVDQSTAPQRLEVVRLCFLSLHYSFYHSFIFCNLVVAVFDIVANLDRKRDGRKDEQPNTSCDNLLCNFASH